MSKESSSSHSGKLQREDVELLLDAHLLQLTPEDRKPLEERLSREPAFAAAAKRLDDMLEPLEAWTMASPPAELAERVLQNIPRTATNDTYSGLKLAPIEDSPAVHRPWFTLREFVAVAACLAVFVGLAFYGMADARFNARRTLCGNNLRMIYTGAAGYAATFGGQLPNAGTVPGGYWLRTASATVPAAPNSRHQYLLLRFRFVPKPETFICPGRSEDAQMNESAVTASDDFPTASNCSYDSQNMSGRFTLHYDDDAIPYQSDANPLFDDIDAAASSDPSSLNSRSHGFRGQNVLNSDGTIAFTTTPFVGPGRDNIWQAGELTRYSGNEIPADTNDVFMVPGEWRRGDRTFH